MARKREADVKRKPERRKPGRPRFVPTDKMRDQVEWRASVGWSIENCAAELGIAVNTFKQYFSRNHEIGKIRKRGDTIDMMVTSARAGNVSAIKSLAAMQIPQPGETNRPLDKDSSVLPAARAAKLGKKEIANIAAEQAGQGTEWGGDLIPDEYRVMTTPTKIQ